MMNNIKKILLIWLFLILCWPNITAFAQTGTGEWTITNFQSDITLNKDSSATIIERITANCEACTNRHGIFRILPIKIKTEKGTIDNPIILKSITDFNRQPYQYLTIKNWAQHTVTWKIGDPKIEVSGLNYYLITYEVKNVIRQNTKNDEFYWNLSGNNWNLNINNFEATIHFPSEISKDEVQNQLYSGKTGSKENDTVSNWLNNNTLLIKYADIISPGSGITLSSAMPKNVFQTYKKGLNDYVNYLWFLIPLTIFIIIFLIWKKYGRDPHLRWTVVPEFSIPENLSPIEMGCLWSQTVKNNAITAGIIQLAVRGIIKIEKLDKKSFLNNFKDYKFIKLKDRSDKLSYGEKQLLDLIFTGNCQEIKISEIKEEKNNFSQIIDFKNEVRAKLEEKGLFEKTGFTLRTLCIILASIQLFGSFYLLNFGIELFFSILLSAIIIFIFSLIMPRRSLEGEKLLYKIKGFQLYLKTAERYRQQFNEKENIFEQYLPYAILFNLTDHWIRAIKSIYGEKFINSYYPLWFSSPANVSAISFNELTNNINEISSSISSLAVTSSGVGGSGFAGGGGGGGGGGGW